jgi:hypothetical protein
MKGSGKPKRMPMPAQQGDSIISNAPAFKNGGMRSSKKSTSKKKK